MEEKKIYPVNEVARFFGRTVASAACHGVFFDWSGSGFVFRFHGTGVRAFLLTGESDDELPAQEGRGYIGVFVDDLPYAVSRFPLDKPADWYILADGLPYAEHTVRVVKQTEVGNGRAAVTALSADGCFLEPPAEKPIRLEFIGDSITCGYGNICSNESPDFVTREEDFSLTFASIAAHMLDAELSCVAASGNGFYHDYGCNTHNLIPQLYLYADKMLDENYGREPLLWDFDTDKRDAVIIKLGQNDAQFCIGADLQPDDRTDAVLKKRRADFEEHAVAFLTKITQLRPGTPVIFIFESDMVLRKEAESAAARVKGIIPMEIKPKQAREGVGANGHWSPYTHARVALELYERIKEILCLQ